ncbi:MAG: acyl-CoA dehydrogenase [Acidimicrobiales bacterium]|nr:MAG: acyl-CoA dehydrogenase [Acidimicrobiales bacterium]
MDLTEPELDAAPLVAWLAERGIALTGETCVRRLVGGRSNLTFALRDATGFEVVVRRPPLGKLLATAHDTLREARIIDAVGAAGIPVPRVLATCDDPVRFDAPFAVFEMVDGVVVRDIPSAVSAPAALSAHSGPALVDALAMLHGEQVAALGLDDLERPGSYVERQLRRWSAQWQATRSEESPLLETTHRVLVDRAPRQQAAALVHGDPKLDNCIFSNEGELRALVDWELSTVGDPLADFALFLAYWAEPGDDEHALQSPPSVCDGFARRAELIERYAAQSALDLEALPYYLAFSYWKLACVVSGVHARLASGSLGAATENVTAYARQVERLTQLSHDALTAL